MLGGFVSEGHGEDVSSWNPLLEQMRDTIGDDASFTGACAGEDEHRAMDGGNGFALPRVEFVEERHKV